MVNLVRSFEAEQPVDVRRSFRSRVKENLLAALGFTGFVTAVACGAAVGTDLGIAQASGNPADVEHTADVLLRGMPYILLAGVMLGSGKNALEQAAERYSGCARAYVKNTFNKIKRHF